MNTLLLDILRWDIVLNANGNIALATDPYSMAQDVSSACRLFIGELWYDTAKGIPYFQNVLGQSPPVEFLKAQLEGAALTVPGVVEARATIQSFVNGNLSGQVQFSDKLGTLNTVTLDIGSPVSQENTTIIPPPSGDRLGVNFILGQSVLG